MRPKPRLECVEMAIQPSFESRDPPRPFFLRMTSGQYCAHACNLGFDFVTRPDLSIAAVWMWTGHSAMNADERGQVALRLEIKFL